ncbi:MAG: hypothetical protein FWC16_01370 [Defluviitaleaceae bacterium]|nr:hypothetical protein [Defluviitaleaceae bacterium]MCL2273554.1 hypothetical protein [Defluviitaleaceae bacterium]
MKRTWFYAVTLLLAAMFVLSACGDRGGAGGVGEQRADADFPSTPFVRPTGVRGEGVEIVIYGWNDELSTAMERYREMNPDFRFTFRPVTHFTDWDGSYETGLNAALLAGGADAPDVFFVESAFVVNYTQYYFAHHAMSYSELLGVNVRPLIQQAEISQFIVDAGTNRDGNVVGLGFQHTGAGFIYRRDLAEQIWGDGSPAAMAQRIGSNSGNWNAFLAAAADANAAGISMLSDMADAWQAIRNSPYAWIQNDRLVICDQRMSYLDIGKALYQGGFTNVGGVWNDSWFADMAGTGLRPVMGFLGPAWLINYVMAGNAGDTVTRDAQGNIIDGVWGLVGAPEAFAWGGTWTVVNRNSSPEVHAGLAELIYWLKLDTSDTGFLYLFGSGTLYDGSAIEYYLAKDMVSSQVVQRRLDSTLPFLGGQDMAPVFVEAGRAFTTHGWGPFDREINGFFDDWSMAYFRGELTREEMLNEFRQQVLDELDIRS